MKISEIILGCNNNFEIFNISREEEFDSLGLANSNLKFPFCTFIVDEKYINNISKNARMIIASPKIAKLINDRGVCICEDPRITFFKLHNQLAKADDYRKGKEFKTIIGDNCNISKLAYIAENNVKIGDNVTIEEFVSIKQNSVIGDNVIIRAGSIIGSVGFEFKRNGISSILSVLHCGGVILKDNVEIQYNTCVDKAVYPWDNTEIGEYTKLDNLVHIGHAAKIGDNCLLAANSLIGGRSIIGSNSWVGVSATISNGLVLGENISANIGAVVTKDIKDGESVTGNFAINHKKFIRFIKSIS